MKLETALDEYGLLERRRHRGEEGRVMALALSALREYLLDYAGLEETEAVRPETLLQFLLDHYPAEEDPEPAVALALLEACAGFALWLIERGERGLAPFASAADGLRKDLPRAMEALAALREHAARDDLGGTVPVSEEDAEEAEEGGAVSSGLDRMVDLEQVRYTEAEMDYYTVERVASTALSLRSSGRDALEEGIAEPVWVPARAAELLRPGDIIYAEIAPAASGWELLAVFAVRPGGYD